MKRIVSTKLKISTLLAALLFVPTVFAAVGDVASLKHIGKDMDQYVLLTGKMVYKEATNDQGVDGYLPERDVKLDGKIYRKIKDYPANVSALMLYREFSQHLKNNGYEVVFHCERENCGDVEGWQLYLYRGLVGDINKQFYIVAKKKIGTSSEKYVAYYATDIGSRPRSLLDTVWTNSAVMLSAQ